MTFSLLAAACAAILPGTPARAQNITSQEWGTTDKGERVEPSQYYFRTTPTFETASEKYRFLNRIVCVATGRREPTGPVYDVFHIL